MSNAPVATAYTHDFVRSALPPGTRRILEIGCGNGELARRLMDDGFEVVAIDSDRTCVEEAMAAHVDARLMDWPANVDGAFDAVLFTRSLHHIDPLDKAVEAASAAVRSGGRIIVEDFQAEGGSERSSAWFAQLLRSLREDQKVSDVDALIARIAPDDHGHVLHSSSAIAEALARRGTVQQRDAAYYFRYLEAELGEAATCELLETEVTLIESEAIDALGKRFVLLPRG